MPCTEPFTSRATHHRFSVGERRRSIRERSSSFPGLRLAAESLAGNGSATGPLIPLNKNEMGDLSLTSLSRRHHKKSTSVDLNLLPYAELFRLRRTTLRAQPPLYNPHSHN